MPNDPTRVEIITGCEPRRRYGAEQKASVQAAIEKKPFAATRKVGGEMRELRFRPWYFKFIGLWLTSINYGTSPLPDGK
jgi:hypothetical protein